jgi:hypothetical protein
MTGSPVFALYATNVRSRRKTTLAADSTSSASRAPATEAVPTIAGALSRPRHSQDNVAVGLGGAAHLGEPIDELAVEPEPDQAVLALE